jgi:hypothetical protein
VSPKNLKLKIESLWVVVASCYKELRLISSSLVRMLDVEKCGVEDTSSKNRNGKCE